MENAKMQNFKCDILSNFQTMCEWVVIMFQETKEGDKASLRSILPIRILEESSRQVSLSHQREKKSPAKKLLP